MGKVFLVLAGGTRIEGDGSNGSYSFPWPDGWANADDLKGAVIEEEGESVYFAENPKPFV